MVSRHSLGKLAWFVVSAIAKTLSIRQYGSDDEFYRDGGKPVIFAVWHGRMIMPLFCRRNRGVYILVSEHRDGELITASLMEAGCGIVRGSTTRGGVRALVEMLRLLKRGARIAVTPDGPRGPRWRMQSGIVYLAAKGGYPIVPLTGSASRAYYFKSWDSFQLPLPFAKAVLCVGEPYTVSGGLDDENIEYHRAELEKRMIELTLKADRLAGADTG
ncbi:lysophospholipid acyltransferase family protein [bacterium]|nr:lysophospholipid acyltransferase family protein [bacterium]